MPSPIHIRYSQPADFDQWLLLWKGYQHFYQATIPDEVSRETWRRFQAVDEPMWCSVAEQEGRLIGIVHHLLHRSCWTTGDYCYLQDLFVDASQRGHGVGRSLIEHVAAEARAKGASRVHWLTHETNADAQKLYERIAARSGFIQYRIVL
jgi:GNAT superfamily N-acetyltransferase